MCLFIVWNPHWVQQTLQFTPLVLELFLISLISAGENSAFAHFAAAI